VISQGSLRLVFGATALAYLLAAGLAVLPSTGRLPAPAPAPSSEAEA
jgi:hypothetical protein